MTVLSQASVVRLQARDTYVSRGSIQEKSSNLTFVKKCVRLHLSY